MSFRNLIKIILFIIVLVIFFYLVTCNRFGASIKKEIDGLDKSCEVDADCIRRAFGWPGGCGGCFNKGVDLSEIHRKEKIHSEICCLIPSFCPQISCKKIDCTCQNGRCVGAFR